MLALTKVSIDAAELSAIVARRMAAGAPYRDILTCLRRGLDRLMSRSITLDGPDERIFRIAPRSKNASPSRKGNFRLIDFDHPLQGVAVWIDHRSPQLLRQEPGGLVGDAELVLQLPRRHPVWNASP